MKSRIFVVSHSTQLLIVQHLRLHAGLPPAREFLIWHAVSNSPDHYENMRSIIESAGFESDLALRGLEIFEPRTGGALGWALTIMRRYRSATQRIRSWVQSNSIDEQDVELWVDEPIHMPSVLALAFFRRARRVKFPHAFNHEDETSPYFKDYALKPYEDAHWSKRRLLWPLIRWVSGLDLAIDRLSFQTAYTFGLPSCWSQDSRDVSRLVSSDAFLKTYTSLPLAMRREFESFIGQIKTAPRPFVVLLLFGLEGPLPAAYQAAVTRILEERADKIGSGTFIVKVHPGSHGKQEEELFSWMRAHMSNPLVPLRMLLNFEFMLPVLRPDYVLAGPCGALPIVRRLRIGEAIVLPEIRDIWKEDPDAYSKHEAIIRDIAVW